MNNSAIKAPPRAWKYWLTGLLVYVLLLPAWVWFCEEVYMPSALLNEQDLTMKHGIWLLGVPALMVLLVGTIKFAASDLAAREAQGHGTPTAAASAPTAVDEEQAKREYVLEVISLGVTLDKYRQGMLWDALSKGSPHATIREQDPKKYPWTAQDKNGVGGGRIGDTLVNGAKLIPDFWGIPTFAVINGALTEQNAPEAYGVPYSGIGAGQDSSGMAWHIFVPVDWRRQERPDRIVERIFAFFDENPDVPFVVLSAEDDLYGRDYFLPPGATPLIRDGYYIPEMPDSATLIVLARRERAEAMKRYEWDEDVNEGYTQKLFLADRNLRRSLPRPEGWSNRPPTSTEWREFTRGFIQKEGLYSGHTSLFGSSKPPQNFKPTPWMPLPWTKFQHSEFDKLPSLGYLHRPVFVPMLDKDGKPLTRRAERAKALAEGWQQALATLPEAERKQAPGRVITSGGGNVDQTILLHGVMNDWAEQGGPELDSRKPTQWIDTDARLGNTGAATWFMQMSIGVMGSYIDGGASVAINMRDPNEASIVFVTPPPPEKVKQQPSSEVLFKHKFVPAIDPANYQN
jgi:Protein of unknown function (DUF2875)